MKTMRAAALAMLVSAATQSAWAQGLTTVSIDPRVAYQTIDGFGGMWGIGTSWDGQPFYTDVFIDRVVNDLGLSMHRPVIPAGFERVNDNADPAVTTLDGFNLTVGGRDCEVENMSFNERKGLYIALREAAERNGETIKFAASVLSAPHWMKVNNCVRGGDPATNKLKEGVLEEYAEYCAAYVKILKRECGIDLYALSIQNEPYFAQETFQSTFIDAPTYRDVLKAVSARLVAEGLGAVKLFGAEDMLGDIGGGSSSRAYMGTINTDATAKAALGIVAVHGYIDGVSPGPYSTAASLWRSAERISTTLGKPMWMSETSGYTTNWDDAGAYGLSVAILLALRYGKISGWMWQALSTGDDYGLMTRGVPNKKYYASKQFYRYIRPGARMVSNSSSDSNSVFSAAFTDEQRRTMTVVLVNSSDSPMAVAFSGTDLPASFQHYQTTDIKNCATEATVQTSTGITIPARSVSTLLATDYDPPVVSLSGGAVKRAPVAVGQQVSALRCDLRGRMLSPHVGSTSPVARGIVCVGVVPQKATVRMVVQNR